MKIKLKESLELQVVGYGYDSSSLSVEVKYEDGFDSLENSLEKLDETAYILGDEDEKLESLHNYTKIDGIRKNIQSQTYSITLKKMTEYEILNKKIVDNQLAIVEIYEGGLIQ